MNDALREFTDAHIAQSEEVRKRQEADSQNCPDLRGENVDGGNTVLVPGGKEISLTNVVEVLTKMREVLLLHIADVAGRQATKRRFSFGSDFESAPDVLKKVQDRLNFVQSLRA